MAKPRARLHKKQRALFDLLRARSGRVVTQTEILKATGWKPSTWRVYANNGFYAPYLREVDDGKCEVTLDPSVTEEQFVRQVTQSTKKKDPTGHLKHPLSRALLLRSRDNMLLALEIFNRPSLANRMDGFAILFCTAWEQLLKAEIIEHLGEAKVYRKKKANRRQETLSLDECLETQIGDPKDPVRRNILRIAELRHSATHFVVPEIQAPFAYLFQAGVVNYAKRYRELAEGPFLPRSNVGLLSLAGQGEKVEAASLASIYGQELSSEIAQFADTLEKEIESVDDERFAVRLEIRMRFAGAREGADVTLVQATEAPANAVVLEKAVDPEKIFPHRTSDVERLVRERSQGSFNRRDLQAILWKTKWKGSNNEYHRLQKNPDTSKFSDKCIDEIVQLIGQPDYLANARKSYSTALARKRKGSA